MKLHELEIAHARPGAPRHREAIAAGDVRIGRFLEDLTGAAGGQQHRARVDVDPPPVVEADVRRRGRSRPERRGVWPARDRGRAAGDARPRDARACARSRGPSRRARAARAARCARLRARARAGRRRRDRSRRPSRAARARSAAPRRRAPRRPSTSHRPGARLERVVAVQVDAVVGAQRRGNAALRVAGVALGAVGLGDQHDRAVRHQVNGRPQAGDAAADHDEIRAKTHRVLSYHPLSALTVVLPLPSEQILVQVPPRPYAVEIGAGHLARLASLLDGAGVGRRRVLVSSPVVWKLHGEAVAAALPDAPVILVPDGERHKQLQTVSRIYDALVKQQIDRGAALVGLGGGVLGDVTGFAAATYLRGIDIVHVPTTLLAQVDSAIGGKVGVNHPLGKNLIGAFHQPRLVVIDPLLVATLPRREFRAGPLRGREVRHDVEPRPVRSRRPLGEGPLQARPRRAAAGDCRKLRHQGRRRRARRARERPAARAQLRPHRRPCPRGHHEVQAVPARRGGGVRHARGGRSRRRPRAAGGLRSRRARRADPAARAAAARSPISRLPTWSRRCAATRRSSTAGCTTCWPPRSANTRWSTMSAKENWRTRCARGFPLNRRNRQPSIAQVPHLLQQRLVAHLQQIRGARLLAAGLGERGDHFPPLDFRQHPA